jgi:putative ABC transport system permease protein
VRLLRRSMLREIRARRGPFLAVIVTVVLGVALFGASYDAFLNLTASYEQLYTETHFADVTAVGGDPASVAAAAATVPDVQATSTRSVADVPIKVGDQQLLGRAVGLPDDGSPAPVNDVLVLDGTRLDPSTPNGVLVEQHMANNFNLKPGDTIQILDGTSWRELKVLGTVFSPEYIWLAKSRQEVFVLPDDFGVLFAPQSLVSALPATAVQGQALAWLGPDGSQSATEATASAMRSAGALDVMTKAEQPSNAALQEDVSGFGEMSLAFPIMFLGAAAFATFVLLGRMIASQRGVIGTLRANGMGRRTVTLHYTSYGVAVGVIGSVLGALLGALLAGVISSIYTGELGIPSRVTDVRATTVAAGVVIGLLASIAAAWVPARRAAAMNPAQAMRGVAPVGSGGESLLERVVPPLRRLPVRWRVALRGIGRNPRRSLATMGGVVFASILILASWGMIDTVDILMHRQFVDVARQDASVYPIAPVTQEVVAPIAAVDGISQAEPGAEWPVSVSSGANSYLTQLTAFQHDTTMHGFYDASGHELALPNDGVLLGVALRNRLHVEVGDTVTLSLATGAGNGTGPVGSGEAAASQVSADATVAGFVNEPLGTPVYASLPYLSSILGGAATAGGASIENVVYVRYSPDANAEAVTSALRQLDGVAAVVNNQALFDLMNQFLGLFYAFIGVMVVLGGILAFALIYNTLMASISERASEIAVLRTLGMPSATVSRLITGENLLLTAIGLVPGLVIGYLVAAVFMASFSSDMFQFNLDMRPTTLLLTAVAIVITGLLSQVPALRAVRHLELGRIVRERAS